MIHIQLIAFLLGAFSCSQHEIPDAQNHNCWEITVDDSLYNALAGGFSDHSEIGRIDESIYGPISLQDGCLFIPIWVGAHDLEYKLVWNGKVNESGADVYLYIENQTPSGTDVPQTEKCNRIYFNVYSLMSQPNDSIRLNFHYFSFYKEIEG